MANLKDVIYLSNEDYETLVSTGTVTIDGQTLTYDENNVYITPDKLASQTEDGLMSAADKVKLDDLSVDSDLVHKAGAETISGVKTFSNGLQVNTLKDLNGNNKIGIGTNIAIYGSNLISGSNGSYDLGIASYRWRNLYLSGGLSDGNNADYKLLIPTTTSWTANKTIATTDDITINAATDDILDSSITSKSLKYAPYTTQQSKLSFDTSSTNPLRTDRLNLNGKLYATSLYTTNAIGFTNTSAIINTSDDQTYNNVHYGFSTDSGSVSLVVVGDTDSDYAFKIISAFEDGEQVYTWKYPFSSGTVALTSDITITSATDDILDATITNKALKYAPYASGDKAAGRLYLGTTNPTNSTRLNYDGYLYAKKLYSEGSEVLTSYNNYYATSDFTSSNGTKIATGYNKGTASTTYDLYVPNATTSQAGVITTGAQTFNGSKTFEVTNVTGTKSTTISGNILQLSGSDGYVSYTNGSGEHFTFTYDVGGTGSFMVSHGDMSSTSYSNVFPSKSGTLALTSDFNTLTSTYQSSSVVVGNAVTNINGRVFQNYTATGPTTVGNYTFYQILKNGQNPTEEEAAEYMRYMTGSLWVPKYNYDFPKQTIFTFADRSTWKPQYSTNDGLRLYRLTTSLALSSDIPSVLPNPNKFTISANTSAATPQKVLEYDGSATVSLIVNPSSTAGAFELTSGSTTRTIQLAGSFTDTNYYATSDYTSSNGTKIATGYSSGTASTTYDLYVPNATSSQAGIVTTGNQIFGGHKTFNSIGLIDGQDNYSMYTDDNMFEVWRDDNAYGLILDLNDRALVLNSNTDTKTYTFPSSSGTLATVDYITGYPVYSSSETYNADDMVLYEGKVYKCLQDNTTGQTPATISLYWIELPVRYVTTNTEQDITKDKHFTNGATLNVHSSVGVVKYDSFLTSRGLEVRQGRASGGANPGCVYGGGAIKYIDAAGSDVARFYLPSFTLDSGESTFEGTLALTSDIVNVELVDLTQISSGS